MGFIETILFGGKAWASPLPYTSEGENCDIKRPIFIDIYRLNANQGSASTLHNAHSIQNLGGGGVS